MNAIDIDNDDISKVQIRELQANVNKSTQLYKEFWSQLSTDQPDLSKLESIGAKAKKSVSDAQGNWDKLMEADINDTNAMRLYGRFLTEVIHNKEVGTKLLQMADNIKPDNPAKQQQQDRKESKKGKNEVERMITEQNPQQQKTISEQEEALLRGFSSRKALAFIAKEKKIIPSIKKLHFTGLLAMVLLLAIALLGYFFAVEEFDNFNNAFNFELLYKSNLRTAEMLRSASKAQNLYLINVGLLNNTAGYTEDGLRSDLQTSFRSAITMHEDILKRTSLMSPANLDLLNSPVVKLYSFDNYYSSKGLIQATEEIISRGYNLLSRVPSGFNLSNPDYYFFIYNQLNDYYRAQQEFSQLYAAEMLSINYTISVSLLILFIASIAALVLAVLAIFRMFQRVNKEKDEALSLFLNIPDENIKSLEEKCNGFIADPQVQGVLPELEEEFVPRKNRKGYKKFLIRTSFIVKVIALAILLQGYYVYTFASERIILGDVSPLIQEFNITSFAEPLFAFANNAQKQLFINYSVNVLGTDAEDIAEANIRAMQDLNSLILTIHSANKNINSDDYNTIFDQFMAGNACNYMPASTNGLACNDFADRTVSQGMTAALSRQVENFKSLFECFSNLKRGSTCSLTPSESRNVEGDPTRNAIINLLRTDKAFEIDTMQDLYIKQTFRTLQENFLDVGKELFTEEKRNHQKNIRLIIIIVFGVVLGGIYALWLWTVHKTDKEIRRSKLMLTMIPPHIAFKIPALRLYLKKFYPENKHIDYDLV